MEPSRRKLLACSIATALIGTAAIALPVSGAREGEKEPLPPALGKMSSVVAARMAIRGLDFHVRAGARRADATAGGVGPLPFNRDDAGLPQNEEAVTACRPAARTVLGGTNDYRGLLDPEGNFSGWHLSLNGGKTVDNEGLLPSIDIAGRPTPSGGDPVVASDDDCNLYYADLNFAPELTFSSPNGIGVYKSDPATLAAYPGGTDPSCWPKRTAAAFTANPGGPGKFPTHFLDKPWMDVGRSGPAGEVVWVTYTDFTFFGPGDFDFTNQIKAVRCDADLTACSAPILLSGTQNSLQFSYVTIGPDGRTYVTWEEDNDFANDFQPPERMRFWMRVAEPGSTSFGPAHLVAEAPLNLGIADLHANDFRVATAPKNAVALVGGRPRVFVTYDECSQRVAGDTVCEEPQIKLTWSDDLGETWSAPTAISTRGDAYFPTISWNRSARRARIAVAYYTTRFDPVFHNRQDVEMVSVNALTGGVIRRQRVTDFSNDPEADPILGGGFIGDYFQVFALGDVALVHYNANYRRTKLLGEGTPIPQQDNFLARVGF